MVLFLSFHYFRFWMCCHIRTTLQEIRVMFWMSNIESNKTEILDLTQLPTVTYFRMNILSHQFSFNKLNDRVCGIFTFSGSQCPQHQGSLDQLMQSTVHLQGFGSHLIVDKWGHHQKCLLIYKLRSLGS